MVGLHDVFGKGALTVSDSTQTQAARGISPRPSTGRTYAVHDWGSDEPISYTVVMALAAVRGTDPTELPPLYDSIDVDALDELFAPSPADDADGDGSITFTHADHEVVIYADGWITIDPIDDRMNP